jgi:hypothetical protein
MIWLVTEDKEIEIVPTVCAAGAELTETQVFPLSGNCSNVNCAHTIFAQFVAQLKACLGHNIPIINDHNALTRTSSSPWNSGRTSRDRNTAHTHGTYETHSLSLICRIFGYKTYVSSTARDHGDNRGNDRLNWTSPGDNTTYRFEDGVTFESLKTLAIAEFWTNVNRKDNSKKSSYYQTWINTITCKDKI